MSIETFDWHELPERPGVFVPDVAGPITLHRGDMLTINGELTETPDGLLVPMPWATSQIIRDPENTCWSCGGTACRGCTTHCPTCGVTL